MENLSIGNACAAYKMPQTIKKTHMPLKNQSQVSFSQENDPQKSNSKPLLWGLGAMVLTAATVFILTRGKKTADLPKVERTLIGKILDLHDGAARRDAKAIKTLDAYKNMRRNGMLHGTGDTRAREHLRAIDNGIGLVSRGDANIRLDQLIAYASRLSKEPKLSKEELFRFRECYQRAIRSIGSERLVKKALVAHSTAGGKVGHCYGRTWVEEGISAKTALEFLNSNKIKGFDK